MPRRYPVDSGSAEAKAGVGASGVDPLRVRRSLATADA